MEVELDITAGTDDPLELGNLIKLDVVDMLADELKQLQSDYTENHTSVPNNQIGLSQSDYP